MLIGVMSDTHDNVDAIKRAVKVLVSRNVDFLIHCGDYISPFTIKLYRELKCPFYGVYGNNDGDKYTLNQRFKELNAEVHGQPHLYVLGERKIFVIHGLRSPETTKSIVYALAEKGELDVIIYGHTHVFEEKRTRKTLILNPGEVCGYLTGKKTVALLETKELKVERIDL